LPSEILVVGAGFAGATSARELAARGISVHVIDKRPHIGGNAYDEVGASGVRIHRYGPHVFHTSNKRIARWIQRFGAFLPYDHRVQALLPTGQYVPLPINRRTINMVFDVDLATPEDVIHFLRGQCIANATPANAAEYLNATIGPVLTDLFFRPYTKKMWAHDLEDMDASVVRRIPTRTDDEDRYFAADQYQFLPENGYTELLHSILDHPLIRVTTELPFEHIMLSDYAHCFNSMAIDEYFSYELGYLPYRSVKFHHHDKVRDFYQATTSVINFTDSTPFTRMTNWSLFPGHVETVTELTTLTLEEPCDYMENDMERYYPVKLSDGRAEHLYKKYQVLAARQQKVTFIGRCGKFQYLNMDQVINQSISCIDTWFRHRRS
jgi:UDP-galactopyranose mutase